MKLKDLKGILIDNVILATIENNGEENYLHTSHDFDFDEDIPTELWERQVDNIYSWYDEDAEESYTMVWLGW